MKLRCGQCGGTGHNARTCTRKAGVREDGARVRELAPVGHVVEFRYFERFTDPTNRRFAVDHVYAFDGARYVLREVVRQEVPPLARGPRCR